MTIWMDPEFQRRVTQLLIYCAEYIETDAECYKESVAVDGNLTEGDETSFHYYSMIEKVMAIDKLLTEIAADKGAAQVDV